MSIDSWTSEGMDWSSVDALRFKPLYPYCEAIRLAIQERFIVEGVTLYGIFVEGYDIHLKPLSTFCNAVQSAVSTLMEHYVNIEDLSDIPHWTDETMMQAIGDDVRIKPNYLKSLSDWIFQQYQIINKLTHRKRLYPQFTDGLKKRADGWGCGLTAKTTAEYIWTIALEQSYNGVIDCIEGWIMGSDNKPEYIIMTLSSNVNMNPSILLQTDLPADIDILLYATKYSFIIGESVFDSCGTGLIENQYVSIFSAMGVTKNMDVQVKRISPGRPVIPPVEPPYCGGHSVSGMGVYLYCATMNHGPYFSFQA